MRSLQKHLPPASLPEPPPALWGPTSFHPSQPPTSSIGGQDSRAFSPPQPLEFSPAGCRKFPLSPHLNASKLTWFCSASNTYWAQFNMGLRWLHHYCPDCHMRASLWKLLCSWHQKKNQFNVLSSLLLLLFLIDPEYSRCVTVWYRTHNTV